MKSQTISDEALQKATGKTWEEWFALLKKMNASELNHKDIAGKLYDEYGVSGWWAQGITVEFERLIGRREVGQIGEDNYQTAASKTLTGSLDDALKAWQKLVGGRRDFDNVAFADEPNVRTTDKWRYWRVNLADQTKVVVIIGRKDENKAQLTVNHEKLPNKAAVDRWKQYWKEFLQGLL